MHLTVPRIAGLLAVGLVAACSDTREPLSAVALEPAASPTTPRNSRGSAGSHTERSGGPSTVFDQSAAAFSLPAPNLDADELELHEEGDEAFDATFVPGTAPANGGLGPVFDNTSCTGCHVGDGRGRPPVGAEAFSSMLFRASIPGTGAHGSPNPVPGFGGQLQLDAIAGFGAGVRAQITYTDSIDLYADGTTYSLRVPTYRFTNPYTLLPPDLLVSPRVAPAVFGLGLLEAVPEGVVRSLADDGDRDRDGISGRTNQVWDVALDRYVMGRFGWKASAPTLRQQTAGAYNGDMGITSSLFPGEPCEGYRLGCERHAAEVSDAEIAAATFYQQTLGVPARRLLGDATTSAGETAFLNSGCGDCHTATLPTGRLAGVKASSGGTIHPYTDLLLHDMGPALADGRPDFLASGSEWRTPPLWGIGLVRTVNGHTNFLHDGRARNLTEAILWHGGEATKSQQAFRQLPARSRADLIAFLESL
jgi:CxxC motif-containing protein (DUF1111 family)